MNSMDSKDRNKLAIQIFVCCREVHQYYGPNILSSVFKEALAYEMRLQGLGFRLNPAIRLDYKGIQLNQQLMADFIVENEIILEICTEEHKINWHKAKLQNLLLYSNTHMGLLIDPSEIKLTDGFIKIFNPKIHSL